MGRYLGELTGQTPAFTVDPTAIEGTPADVTRLREWSASRPTVTWPKGIRRMVQMRNPEMLVGD